MRTTVLTTRRTTPMPDASAPAAVVQRTFERCAQALCRFFSVRTRNDTHLVDDLMQQLWLRARLNAADVRDPNPEPWLWRIAQNLLHEHRRRQGRAAANWAVAWPELARALAHQFDTQDLPLETLARREVQEQLLLALTELPSDEQELLIRVYFENHSHAQLATALGLSERAIEGRLYRARLALRNRLAHLGI